MQAVCDKIAIDNCWSSRPSSPEINTATVVARHTQDHSCVARPRISGLAFVTDYVAKMLKNATFLLVMDSYAGYPLNLHF